MELRIEAVDSDRVGGKSVAKGIASLLDRALPHPLALHAGALVDENALPLAQSRTGGCIHRFAPIGPRECNRDHQQQERSQQQQKPVFDAAVSRHSRWCLGKKQERAEFELVFGLSSNQVKQDGNGDRESGCCVEGAEKVHRAPTSEDWLRVIPRRCCRDRNRTKA